MGRPQGDNITAIGGLSAPVALGPAGLHPAGPSISTNDFPLILLRGSGRPLPEIQPSYGQRRVFSLGLRKRVSAGLPPLYACPPPGADHNFTALMDKLSSTLYRNLLIDGGRSARPYESDSEAASNRNLCGPITISSPVLQHRPVDIPLPHSRRQPLFTNDGGMSTKGIAGRHAVAGANGAYVPATTPTTPNARHAPCHISLTNHRPPCYHNPMTASSPDPYKPSPDDPRHAETSRTVNQPKPPLPDSQKKTFSQTTVNQRRRSSARPTTPPPRTATCAAQSRSRPPAPAPPS